MRFLIWFSVLLSAAWAGSAGVAACAPGDSAPVLVARVSDARTLVTTDGREVRLAGVLTADAYEIGAADGASFYEAEAQRVLSEIVVGRRVVIRPADGADGKDRRGRVVGDVHVLADDGAPRWVQGAMIAAGLAVAMPEPAAVACHDDAMAAEADARRSGAGVYATSVWRIVDLARDDVAAGVDGSFRIVTGEVRRSWRQRNGTVLLVDGGRRRGTEVEVMLDGAALRAIAPGKDGEKGLVRRRVEVRGWFELRDDRQNVARRQGGARFIVRTGAAGGVRIIAGAVAGGRAGDAGAAVPLIETGGGSDAPGREAEDE